MKNVKKVLLTIGSFVLTAALAIGGTVAYLQAEDSDVNVMTLGNVKIEQLEYERVVGENGNPVKGVEGEDFKADYGITESYKLKEFTQDKPAYPAVYGKGTTAWDEFQQLWNGVGAPGSNDLFDDSMKNVIDKFVFVENTGKSDAYYRTLIAIECPEGLSENAIHTSMNANSRFDYNSDKEGVQNAADSNKFYTVVNGVRYLVYTATYTEILAPGEVSRPSLLQVYLDPAVTNEDCEKFGDTWEILVVSQAIQAEGFADAQTALASFGEPDEKDAESGIMLCADWFGEAIADYEAEVEASKWDTWDGTSDTNWYNDTDTEFTLTTAEQLAGLGELVDGGNTFEGKTITLAINMNLEYIPEGTTETKSFDPIGSYRQETAFKGTFDGQGHTIMNLSQNTWALNNGYYYGDLGLGLFGLVEDATIKNLVMDGASISGESAICGTVAATAYGDCAFENITVKNSKVNDYQYYAGGIVGWASGNHTYKNINVDASTIIGSQWGDFGNASGGIIGGIGSSCICLFEDCTVACRIDAVNDVVSAYQWYNYRNCGMLIGRVPQTITNGEVQTVATPTNVTCKNVTVIYDDWANYTYCEFAGTGYPYVRVQEGVSVEAYSNVRYGHPTDANGNTVVDDNHVHNAGEAHHKLIEFDQLFGGPANHRYCYYGISAFDGVKVVYNNK